MATVEQRIEGGMPVSEDAEKAILGAILLDNAKYFEASEFLSGDEFAIESHRRIFARVRDLIESQRPADIITLSEQLRQQQQLESVGGVSYLASLTDGVSSRSSIINYVNIVKDKKLLRGLIHLANKAMLRAYEQSEPVQEILGGTESDLMALAEANITSGFSTVKEIVRDSFGSIDELCNRGQLVTGLETHYADLDGLTSGFQPSDLIVLAARPSMGKTALALNIAQNAAVLDKRVVAIFSLEMSKESLLLRLLCSQSRVDSHRLRTGTPSREDRQHLIGGLMQLAESPIFIDDAPNISVHEMRAKVRRLRQSQGRLDLIVVDYLQLMAGSPVEGKRYENRTQEVSAISRGLKGLAKEMRVPVIALSQLSRAPEGRTGKDSEPKLSDLRESGAIEQDADVVAFIYRPEMYDRDNPEWEGKAKLLIAKQRNGPTDTIQLAFLKGFTRFETLDRSDWVK
jgi:replicative DNA helicase